MSTQPTVMPLEVLCKIVECPFTASPDRIRLMEAMAPYRRIRGQAQPGKA